MNIKIPIFFKNALVSEAVIILVYSSFIFYEANLIMSRYEGSDKYFLVFILTCLWVGWAYVYTRVIIEYTLLKRRIAWYSILAIAGVLLISIVQFQILKNTFIAVRNTFQQTIVNYIVFTTLTTLVYLGARYLIRSKEYFELEAVKKEVELNQLKNQLNPHFLFNALNNIYSYNLENNKHGNDLVLKLSQLMRFILDTTRYELIPVRDEVVFIDNYIAFEQERLGYRCNIEYDKNIKEDVLVPPLLLFPLIENAFKHGTNAVNQTSIQIELGVTESEVTLHVRNTVSKTKQESTQTGLQNLKRRLELLYPAKHTLYKQGNEEFFDVQLIIQLT